MSVYGIWVYEIGHEADGSHGQREARFAAMGRWPILKGETAAVGFGDLAA